MPDLARQIIDTLEDEGVFKPFVRQTDCQDELADVIRPMVEQAFIDGMNGAHVEVDHRQVCLYPIGNETTPPTEASGDKNEHS